MNAFVRSKPNKQTLPSHSTEYNSAQFEAGFLEIDNRKESVAQRKLQEGADLSSQTAKVANYQQIASNHITQHHPPQHKERTLRVVNNPFEGPAQLIKLKWDKGKYYKNTHADGVQVESDELNREERTNATKDLSADAVTLAAMQLGWRTAAANTDPVVLGLVGDGKYDSGKKAVATRLYLASQDNSKNIDAILEAQKAWQDFLSKEGFAMKDIMTFHRSFGLEYEFATWEKTHVKNPDVPSHTEIAKSEDFSALFDIPFIIETDAEEELEMVCPPLLAGDVGGAVNTTFIKAVHQKLITCFSDLRENDKGTVVSALPLEDQGIGSSWKFKDEASKIKIAKVRKKWAGKKDEIAYQLNLTMKPEEIAAEIEKVKDSALSNDHGTLYKKIRDRFFNSKKYKGLGSTEKKAVNPAILLMSKGISNSIAIPTLSLVAELKLPWPRGDMHSYVKDLHALWVKDSVPNVTLSATKGDPTIMKNLEEIIDEVRGGQDLIPRDVLTNVPNYEPQKPTDTKEVKAAMTKIDGDSSGHTILKKAAEAEAIACLVEIKRRLSASGVKMVKNDKTDFLGEKFGGGEGVRKDTYTNVGASKDSFLHLNEFRSNDATDSFLG